MHIDGAVGRPEHMNPKRPVEGFDCKRSEVSGRRLWGWAASRFGPAEAFFAEWFVLNYCPLGFLEESGRNFTPDRLPAAALAAVHAACDRHLATALGALAPDWAIGIGGFAEKRLRVVLEGGGMVEPGAARRMRVAQILHPSPANPAANRGWVEAVDAALAQLGITTRRSAAAGA
jgi:single-strand selective monofunctional uracil DNA glycosylase